MDAFQMLSPGLDQGQETSGMATIQQQEQHLAAYWNTPDASDFLADHTFTAARRSISEPPCALPHEEQFDETTRFGTPLTFQRDGRLIAHGPLTSARELMAKRKRRATNDLHGSTRRKARPQHLERSMTSSARPAMLSTEMDSLDTAMLDLPGYRFAPQYSSMPLQPDPYSHAPTLSTMSDQPLADVSNTKTAEESIALTSTQLSQMIKQAVREALIEAGILQS